MSNNKPNLSFAEALFVDIFCSLFGEDKRDYLLRHHNVPFKDTEGRTRLHDFVIIIEDKKIAIEIEGETYHNPALAGETKFSEDLLRANAQIIEGWIRVSYTPRNLSENVEIVKKQLKELLGDTPTLIDYPFIEEDEIPSPDESMHRSKVKRGMGQEVGEVLEKYPALSDLSMEYVVPLATKKLPTDEDYLKYFIARGISVIVEFCENRGGPPSKEEIDSFIKVYDNESTSQVLMFAHFLKFLLHTDDFIENPKYTYSALNSLAKKCEKEPSFLRKLALSMIYLHNDVLVHHMVKRLEEINATLLSEGFKQHIFFLKMFYIVFSIVFQYLSLKCCGQRRAIIGVNDEGSDFICTILDKTQYQKVNVTEVPSTFYERNIVTITFLATLKGSKLKRLLMNDHKFESNVWFTLPASVEALYGPLRDSMYLCFNHAVVNRYYVELEPCEFIINAYNVRSITIIDVCEKGKIEYYFKVKYTDDSVEIGIIEMEPNHHCDNKWCPHEKYDLSFVPHVSSSRYFDDSLWDFKDYTQINLDRLQIVIAACLRDLNVMEIETREYNKQRVSKRDSENRKIHWNKVVWLPRKKIIYDNKKLGRLKVVKEKINEFIPVMVNGHLRHCVNPSPKQLELAREYGIIPPEGFTFVRPYTKHIDKNYLTRYRSKSALMILYGED